MLSNLRSAFRQIVKAPGYTTVVVLTLALGIAVNTQIFSMPGAFFLTTMPVRDADRMTAIIERSDLFNLPHGLSLLDIQDIRAGSKTLTDFVGFFSNGAHLSIPGGAAERGWIEAVTPDAFDLLGVKTELGRPLQKADGEMPGAADVAVLTHRYWENHFGSDPKVVGRTVIINGKPFTIVGVAQPDFQSCSWSLSVALFIPSGALAKIDQSGSYLFTSRNAKAWKVLARRRPGASLADANAELAVFAQRFGKDFPDEHRHSRFSVIPERRARPDPTMTDFLPVFAALFSGLVLLVLLIACANVANLMSARALQREREFVVRAALGASRGQLVRQLLVESVVLAALAGIVGYGLSVWGGTVLERFIPTGDVPIRRDQHPGWSLYVFTAGISLLAGFTSGLLPALRASRVDLNEGLKQGGVQQAGPGRHRLRNLLVIGQVAVSCVVLISAALFLRGLQAAQTLRLGFNPDRLLLTSFDLGMQGYDDNRAHRFQKLLVERLRALPGVESAAITQHVPFDYHIQGREIWPENPTGNVPDGHLDARMSGVSAGFHGAFGVPILRGREFTAADEADKAPLVAIINEALAQKLWPGRDAIGQHFRYGRDGVPIEVVGITPTGKYVMLTEAPLPYYYVPISKNYLSAATLIVRASGSPAGLASAVRGVVRDLDPDLPIASPLSFDEHMATSIFALMPMRTGALLAMIQGVIGLGLAVLGLYAVVSYSVTRRTREIGLRMALGASSRDVLRMVSSEGLRLTLTGLGIGLVLSVVLALVLSRVLYGVRAVDLVAYPSVILVLVGTAALACWLPARRATRVDPNIALRAE